MQVKLEIVFTCQVLAEMGFGITRKLLEMVVADYVQENRIANTCTFSNGIPGQRLVPISLKHCLALAERKPQHLSKKRAQATNISCMNAFFDALEKSFRETRLDFKHPGITQQLWNCVETAFCTSATSTMLLYRRGIKPLHEVGGGSGR